MAAIYMQRVCLNGIAWDWVIIGCARRIAAIWFPELGIWQRYWNTLFEALILLIGLCNP